LLALTIACVLFYLSSSRRRRALGILSIVIALGWFTTRLLVHLPRGSQGFFIPKWQLFLAMGLVPLVEATASLFLHKRLLAKD
jgi:hypothetical protein